MLALYRSGRQVEANERFQAYRLRIDEESGLLPGRDLQELHRAMLRHDPGLQPPADHGRRAYADRYSQVVRALFAARLVPVVGPLAGNASPVAAAPARAAVAAHLARVFQYPNDRPGGLTRVSHYVAVMHGVGRCTTSCTRCTRTTTSRARSTARLPHLPRVRAHGLPLQLVVTSWLRPHARAGVRRRGEVVDVVSYVAFGRDRGKFLHVAPDGSIRVIDEPNVEVGLTTEERTIVLKIHGGTVELAPGRDAEAMSSARTTTSTTSRTRSCRRCFRSGLLRASAAATFSSSATSSTTGACASSCAGLGRGADRLTARGRWARRIRSPTDYWRQCGVDPFDVAARGVRRRACSVASRPSSTDEEVV